MSTFDPHIDDAAHKLIGQFTSVKVVDPADPINTTPNHVIDPSKPFNIELEWEVNGNLSPVFLGALADDWVVKVYAESMGPGADVFLAQATLNKGPVAGMNHTYNLTVNVPSPSAAGLVEGNPGGSNSGVYKLVITTFLNSNLGPVGYDISGFEEGPMIRVENPL